MKRNVYVIVSIVTFILLVMFSLNVGAADTIRFGGIFNLTGHQASLGGPNRSGAALAVKEINAKGGILGKQIEFIVEDGKSDQTAVSNAVQKLISVNKVDVLLGLSDTNYVLAAGGIAQQNKIVFLDVGGTMPSIPDLVGEYQFMACFGDNVQAAAMAVFAYDVLNAKTAWMFIDTAMDYTVTLGMFFKESYLALGGKFLLEDTFQTGDVDLRAQITRLKNLDPQPDILVIPADPSMAGLVVKQIREMGIDLPIISGDGFDTPLLIEVAGESADNVYFTTHVSFGSTDPIVQNFIAAYKKEYNREVENAFASLGYDAVYLLADAIKRADSVESDAIRIALGETKNLPGVTGTLSYLNGSRVPTKSVTILQVMDAEISFVQTVMP